MVLTQTKQLSDAALRGMGGASALESPAWFKELQRFHFISSQRVFSEALLRCGVTYSIAPPKPLSFRDLGLEGCGGKYKYRYLKDEDEEAEPDGVGQEEETST